MLQLLSKLTKTTTPSSEDKKGLSTLQAIALAAYALSEEYYLNPQDNSLANDFFKSFQEEGKQNILGNVVLFRSGGDIETSLRLLGHNDTLPSPSLPSTLFLDEKQALEYLPALYNAIRNSSRLTVHLQRSYSSSAYSLYDLGFVVFFSGSSQQAYDTAVVAHLVGSM